MSGRKRKLEQIVSDLKTESGKKQKADESLLSAKSKMASNKGNMNDSVSESELDLNMDTGGEQCLRSFMQNISKDINKSINGLNRRMNQMEDSFEQKLVDKLCTVITQTVKDEIKRVRSDFDSEICAMRTKLLELETVVKESASPGSNGSVQRRPCSVVIRNLKRAHNETDGINSIVKNKVISLVRDGLKLKDVRVTSAERKQSRGDNPGIVIATFETHEQVDKLFEAKKNLRQTNEYRSVYIDSYLSQSELSTQASFRTLLKEIGKSDVYHVHGSKLFPSAGRRGRDQRDENSDRIDQQSRGSRGSSRSGRRHRSRSRGQSPESSRRGQRLREGRSTSNDRSPDGSHVRLPGSPGRAERGRSGQSFDRSDRYERQSWRDNNGRRGATNGQNNNSVWPKNNERGHSR